MLATSGRWVHNLAKTVAVFGGIVLALIALLTVVSITGRALLPFGFKPLRGQFELVEAGTVFVVCAFLPWCHLNRGHASVAIFTDWLGRRFNAFIDLVGDVALLGVALIITWRHLAGMMDKMTYGETTFLLGLPLWWGYAAALVGLVTWVVVGLWASASSTRALFVSPPVKLSGAPR